MPRGPEINWNAKQVNQNLGDVLERRMTRVLGVLERTAKKKVSRLNKPTFAPSKVNKKGKKKGKKRPRSPSKPGEPPKVVSGHLRSNIATLIIRSGYRIIGILGVKKTVPYARRLEIGFSGTDSEGRNVNQEPRPFLIPTVTEERQRIGRILGKGR